jgi:hypothetical protein
MENDLFVTMITSCATGFPKACLTTHRTYVFVCINNAIEKGMGPHDTALRASPLYFIHGRNFSLTLVPRRGKNTPHSHRAVKIRDQSSKASDH